MQSTHLRTTAFTTQGDIRNVVHESYRRGHPCCHHSDCERALDFPQFDGTESGGSMQDKRNPVHRGRRIDPRDMVLFKIHRVGEYLWKPELKIYIHM